MEAAENLAKVQQQTIHTKNIIEKDMSTILIAVIKKFLIRGSPMIDTTIAMATQVEARQMRTAGRPVIHPFTTTSTVHQTPTTMPPTGTVIAGMLVVATEIAMLRIRTSLPAASVDPTAGPRRTATAQRGPERIAAVAWSE
jgi:hypothetical protein